ncbi:MAG: LacI family DNA-binding transcriptional regulator [Stappiaceae bacterium]
MADENNPDAQDMPARKRPRRLTLSHMAEELGISTATVSLALRDSPLVAKETLAKVKEYAEKSGYIYNRSAASLRTSRTNTVGVAVHDIQNPYFAEIFRSLESELEKNRQTIFICNHRDSHERQKNFVDALMQHRADGLILCPSVGTTVDDIETISAQGLPLTLISRDVPGSTVSVVRGNDYSGAKALTEHLIERGHRRIGFVGGRPGTTAWEERHRGWQDALAHAGIDVGAMFDLNDLMTQADGRDAVPRLLARKPRPTAIFAFNDMVALGLMSSLRRAGVAPGRDIAVAGYDDNDGSEAHVPALTSVWNAPEQIGEKAASLMLAQISGGDLGGERVLFEPELRVRESSMFAPASVR